MVSLRKPFARKVNKIANQKKCYTTSVVFLSINYHVLSCRSDEIPFSDLFHCVTILDYVFFAKNRNLQVLKIINPFSPNDVFRRFQGVQKCNIGRIWVKML